MLVSGELTTDTWGSEGVVPRYVDNGIEDSEWSCWGGNLSDALMYNQF